MKKAYKIENLCCAHCANKIERLVSKIKGVEEANLNFMLQKLIVETEGDVTAEIEKIVRKIEPECKVIPL